MADREQSPTANRGTDEKPRDTVGTQTSGSKGQERQHGVKEYGSVPDQSKERNTEIAVEAGHKGGGQREKR